MSVYLPKIKDQVARVLSRLDREPFSITHGCADRLFWGWKFVDFPGARFQEIVYLLAWLYQSGSWDNPWRGSPVVREHLRAAYDFWARQQHSDGSFDEAYPHEHSLAATAFTLFYATEAWEMAGGGLGADAEAKFLRCINKAGDWLCANDELHGVLSNHLATAAAGLYNAAQISGQQEFFDRSKYFWERIARHQSPEGWYEEYGGADPGYQTHGSFYLARLWQKNHDEILLNSLRRANAFLAKFIHPDGSLGGEYASRCTEFYFPAAFEILAPHCPHARAIAAAQREKVADGRTVGLGQMDAQNLLPMLHNYIAAHEAFTANAGGEGLQAGNEEPLAWRTRGQWHYPQAGLLVKSSDKYYAVCGAGKGGVLKVWDSETGSLAFQSSGYVAKIKGRWFSSQSLGACSHQLAGNRLEIEAPFSRVKQKVFSPWLFMMFRVFSLTAGRLPALSQWLKQALVRVLVVKPKVKGPLLRRRIMLEPDSISFEDQINDQGLRVVHLDKFSAIHMGSSRYVHSPEELARGGVYPQARLEYDSRGVAIKGRIF